nr:hypothetical protein HmN_000986700 [Hymenolepis microstoma]
MNGKICYVRVIVICQLSIVATYRYANTDLSHYFLRIGQQEEDATTTDSVSEKALTNKAGGSENRDHLRFTFNSLTQTLELLAHYEVVRHTSVRLADWLPVATVVGQRASGRRLNELKTNGGNDKSEFFSSIHKQLPVAWAPWIEVLPGGISEMVIAVLQINSKNKRFPLTRQNSQ